MLIERAAAAGKHVFCEKPISFDLSRTKSAIEAVERAGLQLQTGFNRRFDPNFSRVRELIATGQIGDPHIIKITSRDPAPPPYEYIQVSGGLFVDMAIHDFDMARFLSGSEVEEVSVAGAVLVDPKIGELGDIDTAITTLRFSSGALGVIDNSRKAAYGYDQRVEVFGSKGQVHVQNEFPNSAELSTEQGVSRDKPQYFFLERYKESYRKEISDFIQAIRTGSPTSVTGYDGLQAERIAQAAKRSLVEKRAVKLSEFS
jgi:myo-inositol 2-dehydrogenase/D-chiro-inositol 1-dehydrogenase